MGYAWSTEASRTAPPRAPKVPEGQTKLKVIDVIFGKKGQAFKSSSGDPQILVVFSDGKGNEASQMYTLGEKSTFNLAKMLQSAGADLRKMEASGIDPKQFAEPNWGKKQLMDREFMADVKHDGDYFIIDPLRPDPSTQEDLRV